MWIAKDVARPGGVTYYGEDCILVADGWFTLTTIYVLGVKAG